MRYARNLPVIDMRIEGGMDKMYKKVSRRFLKTTRGLYVSSLSFLQKKKKISLKKLVNSSMHFPLNPPRIMDLVYSPRFLVEPFPGAHLFG